MALVEMPEQLTQRDIMLSDAMIESAQEMMEAAITMNRQLECKHGMCAERVAGAVVWLANGRFADVSRAAEFVDENCHWSRLESARHSLRLTAA